MSKLSEYFEKLEINPEAQKMAPKPEPKKSTPLHYIKFTKNMTKQEIYNAIQSAYFSKISIDLQAELEEILKFIEPYVSLVSDVETLPSATINSYSLFTFLMDFFILPDKVTEVKFISNDDLTYEMKNVLSKFVGETTTTTTSTEVVNIPAIKYCTFIVTENADLHSAADLLATAWQNNTLPWVIREVLVQENVKTRFTDLVEDRLSKLDDVRDDGYFISKLKERNLADFKQKAYTTVGDKIVVGIPRNYIEEQHVCAPIVSLNVFRTTKEAAALYNKLNGGSASVYSECITEAHELAKTLKAKNIWINCNGVLDSRVPYTFGYKVYGSEMFHYTEQPPVVSGKPGSHKPCERSFFSENYLFTVVSEPRVVAPKEGLAPKLAMLYNFNYKTIVVRFGQTFAN